MCYLCFWDSRYKGNHYLKRDWIMRADYEINPFRSVINVPLVARDNILIPPLHVKLGVVKNFLKVLHEEDQAFHRLTSLFPRISFAKLKEGINIIRTNFVDCFLYSN